MIPLLVVGAGVAGLTIARATKAIVCEKSRGLGGRVATRRIGEDKFDHGLPWWPNTPVAQRLFDSSSHPQGLTALTKEWAKDLVIHKDTRIERLEKIPQGWRAHTASSYFEAENIVLTAPLPQALDLLSASSLPVRDEWFLPYAKALVGLFRWPLGPLEHSQSWDGHQLVLQREKGLCLDGVALFVSQALSTAWFDLSDDEILNRMTQLLETKFGSLNLEVRELKKWRYSVPHKVHVSPYLEAHDNLFLCGDGFLYPGIDGAIRSAETLLRDKFSAIMER